MTAQACRLVAGSARRVAIARPGWPTSSSAPCRRADAGDVGALQAGDVRRRPAAAPAAVAARPPTVGGRRPSSTGAPTLPSPTPGRTRAVELPVTHSRVADAPPASAAQRRHPAVLLRRQRRHYREPRRRLRAASAASAPRLASTSHAVRRDFPILPERVNGRPLVWLDNAATTQKPQAVIDRLAHFYAHENSNIHRAAHELAARATDAYEGAREHGRPLPRRRVARRDRLRPRHHRGDQPGRAELGPAARRRGRRDRHHAPRAPRQHRAVAAAGRRDGRQAARDPGRRRGPDPARRVPSAAVPTAPSWSRSRRSRTRSARSSRSQEMIEIGAPRRRAACWSTARSPSPHMRGRRAGARRRLLRLLRPQDLRPDRHRRRSTARREVLEAMPPWQGGGNMIDDVTFEKTTYQPPPARFEAGTGNIADAVGLGAALDYVERLGMAQHRRATSTTCSSYATARAARACPGLRLIGTAPDKASVLSFVLDGYEPEEVGAALNQEGIAVRSGHHCAQPILRRFGLETTVRPSLALYNTCDGGRRAGRGPAPARRRGRPDPVNDLHGATPPSIVSFMSDSYRDAERAVGGGPGGDGRGRYPAVGVDRHFVHHPDLISFDLHAPRIPRRPGYSAGREAALPPSETAAGRWLGGPTSAAWPWPPKASPPSGRQTAASPTRPVYLRLCDPTPTETAATDQRGRAATTVRAAPTPGGRSFGCGLGESQLRRQRYTVDRDIDQTPFVKHGAAHLEPVRRVRHTDVRTPIIQHVGRSPPGRPTSTSSSASTDLVVRGRCRIVLAPAAPGHPLKIRSPALTMAESLLSVHSLSPVGSCRHRSLAVAMTTPCSTLDGQPVIRAMLPVIVAATDCTRRSSVGPRRESGRAARTGHHPWPHAAWRPECVWCSARRCTSSSVTGAAAGTGVGRGRRPVAAGRPSGKQNSNRPRTESVRRAGGDAVGLDVGQHERLGGRSWPRTGCRRRGGRCCTHRHSRPRSGRSPSRPMRTTLPDVYAAGHCVHTINSASWPRPICRWGTARQSRWW